MTIAIIIALIIVIFVQIGELVFFHQAWTRERTRLLDELSKAVKAVMSRNINEYIAAVNTDKPIEQVTPPENDNIELSRLTQDEWEKAIGVVKPKTK